MELTPSSIWIVASAALVLFMTPGLAFFYGGLVKAKSVISMIMMSFGSIALIGVLWILYGYMIYTGAGGDGEYFEGAAVLIPGFAGNPFAGFGLTAPGIDLIDVAFGSTFAIITVALISGAIADRAKFGAWLVFAGVWATLSYFPVAGWVWGGGWIQSWTIGDYAVIDLAGGTAVHINAGAAALALALVLGKRIGFQKGIHQPHNVPFVVLGASILWFGWFGFNTGLSGDQEGLGLSFLNTIGAPAAAVLGWLIVEKLKDGKATSVGAASGAVAGLVAITPAAGNLTPGWALVLGAIAGAVAALAIELKWKLGYDDSLDVVGIHLVAGLIGTIFLGFAATDAGLFYTGDFSQLVLQTVSAVAVALYSFVIAFAVGFAIEKTIGFRVKNEDELAGVDTVVHGETGYTLAN
ncbi:ammonium transporter [Microbacterium sp. MEC084]|jgi:Amt family ammonium transporter|uniref:ammonium transporter n=1 Tax=unclassified Microbacterium TaxID=2609290 RepID=UPI0006F56792|nr:MULTISPECIES: ammonium transporter [unclassified Microbacterium]KQZ10020.1 ammonia channel protein [Microbacterium sp. Root53]MCD1267364.1 ammonium transporter [Microbacterium sp. MEC084]